MGCRKHDRGQESNRIALCRRKQTCLKRNRHAESPPSDQSGYGNALVSCFSRSRVQRLHPARSWEEPKPLPLWGMDAVPILAFYEGASAQLQAPHALPPRGQRGEQEGEGRSRPPVLSLPLAQNRDGLRAKRAARWA